MNHTHRRALRITAGLLLGIPLHAHALPFELGPIEGNLDTTVSAGVSVRMQDRSSELIGIANRNNNSDGVGSARSVNDDDGNLAYDKGDVFAAPLKATHDLSLRYGNAGLFSRASYFYDFENKDADNLGEQGQKRLGGEFKMLDLFAYGSFNVLGQRVSTRLGSQVVSWGESTFIPNSINSINPVDVSRLRGPGSELKEALLPVPMLWVSLPIADSLSMEAVWLFDWKKTEIDPNGAFFSTTDVLSDDGQKVFAGFGRRFDDNSPPTDLGTNPGEAQLWGERIANREPKQDHQQYGVSFRYFSEAANSTEFGLYYLRYHSRTPIASGVRAGAPGPANPLGLFSYSNPAGGSAFYFADYPEGINLYGLSFNTSLPFGIALQGEYSYRPNQPIQIEDVEVLLAALGLPNKSGVPATTAAGEIIDGFKRVKMHQSQFTATKAFGPNLGADQFVMLLDTGATWLDLPRDILFNGPGTYLPAVQASANAVASGSVQPGGYANRFSWGYRLVSALTYENAIGSASLSPRIVWSHDVNGVGPTFNQDAQAITGGLGFNYLQRWQADLSYTAFTGGRTYSGTDPNAVPAGQSPDFASSANPLKDRDFLSFNVSYAF